MFYGWVGLDWIHFLIRVIWVGVEKIYNSNNWVGPKKSFNLIHEHPYLKVKNSLPILLLFSFAGSVLT